MNVSRSALVGVVDLLQQAATAELAQLEEAGTAGNEDRQVCEFTHSLLAITAAALATNASATATLDTLRQVALSVMGMTIRLQHAGDPPCQRCLGNAVNTVVRELTQVLLQEEMAVSSRIAPSAPADITRH